MLRRDVDDKTEFVMFTLWESMDAVTAFAGERPEVAVFYPDHDRYLLEHDEFVTHFEVDTDVPAPIGLLRVLRRWATMVVVRTIDWDDDHIVLLDQTRLPREECQLHVSTVDELVDAIGRLAVRGAPALGAAGALGVLLAAQEAGRSGWDDETLQHAIGRLRAARPTAVNLARGVDRVLARLPDGTEAVRNEALRVLAEDGTVNRAIGESGSQLLLGLVGEADRVRVYTHCNTGGLATVEWGTALGIVRSLQALDRLGLVYVGETRPLLQGSRLTAWELDRLGADYRIVVDGAGPGVIARGMIDAVVVGADRVAANGDVINKVGTFPLALAAARAGVPFVVAAPESTVDADTPTGDDVRIELRSQNEVLSVGDVPTAPEGARGFNPAFDMTPADLVTALVTELRVVHPAAGETPA